MKQSRRAGGFCLSLRLAVPALYRRAGIIAA
jgi:hypothetical protein